MLQPYDIAQRIKQWTPEQQQGPVTLEIYPTLRCNLDCLFCDTTDRKRPPMNEMPTERWLEIIDEAAQMGVKQVYILGGGEPLVNKDTPLLMDRIKHHNMRGMLTTNGTRFANDDLERMVQTKWDEVHFSVDGPSPEIHDHLRGQKGAFRKTIRTACKLNMLKRSQKSLYPRIALHFVVTNRNYHTLTAMIQLAHAIGAQRVDFDSLIAYRPEQKALMLSKEQESQLPSIAKQAQNEARRLKIDTTLTNFIVSKPARGQQLPTGTQTPGLAGAPCLKAWHHLVIQADGRSSPCCVLAGQGGSAANTSLLTLWKNDSFMQKVRQGMIAHKPLPRCSECSWNILQHESHIREHLAEDTCPST